MTSPTIAALGTYENPVKIDRPLEEVPYPGEFYHRPHIYVEKPNGKIVKWYRSYSDYVG